MSYTFSLLTSVEECDSLLSIANFELKELEAQKSNADLRQDRTDLNAQKNLMSLSLAQAELSGVITALQSVTDAEVVRTLTNRKTKIENRIENLQVDINEKGPVSVLRIEMEQAHLNALIASTEDFIAQLTARKTAIQTGV